jgi:hypothetical protein
MDSTVAFMRNTGHLCECGNQHGGEMRPGVVPASAKEFQL